MNYTVENKQTGQKVTIEFIKQNSAGRWIVIDENEMKSLLAAAVDYQTETLAERFSDRQPDFSTVDEAYDILLNTGKIKYDDEWYAEVGVRKAEKVEKPSFSRKLDCGHIVYHPTHIMQTSYAGTACPDCYDLIESQGYAYKR